MCSPVFICILLAACNGADSTKVETSSTVSQEQYYKEAIAKYPDSLLLKEQLIQYYRDTADYEHAIAIANDAIKKDSLNDRLWDIKGTLYFENEDTLNAARSFETAFRINPEPRYLVLLGSIYAQTKNKRALAIADLLLQTNIAEIKKQAFFIKGLYHNYTGEKEMAISFFDKCLSMDYTFMLGYREKAIALYDMGRYDDAVTVLDKAVTLQNNFDEGYYWLGRCLEQLGKPTDAIEEYKTALRYTPDYVEAKMALERLEKR